MIHAIGMGSEYGAPIPIGMKGSASEYKKDKEGNTIVTKLNEPMLKQIATAGKGVYVRATTNDAGLNAVFNEINKMEKKEYEAKVYSEYDHTYPYFVAAGLLLLIIELLIFERKTKLTRNLDIYGKKRILK